MKNTADASSENTFDAHVKAGVGKCDQEEEHARLGEKREEWPAIVNLIISMSMSNFNIKYHQSQCRSSSRNTSSNQRSPSHLVGWLNPNKRSNWPISPQSGSPTPNPLTWNLTMYISPKSGSLRSGKLTTSHLNPLLGRLVFEAQIVGLKSCNSQGNNTFPII